MGAFYANPLLNKYMEINKYKKNILHGAGGRQNTSTVPQIYNREGRLALKTGYRTNQKGFWSEAMDSSQSGYPDSHQQPTPTVPIPPRTKYGRYLAVWQLGPWRFSGGKTGEFLETLWPHNY